MQILDAFVDLRVFLVCCQSERPGQDPRKQHMIRVMPFLEEQC